MSSYEIQVGMWYIGQIDVLPGSGTPISGLWDSNYPPLATDEDYTYEWSIREDIFDDEFAD